MLYGLVNYNATASEIGVQSSSSSSLCYFVSAISVMVAVVCFSLSLYWLYTFCIDGEIRSCEDAQTKQWASPLKGGKFYSNLYKAETAVWVNFFFWIIIGVLVILQRRQSSGAKAIVGGYGGPAGGLFGDPGVTAAETEPFFNRPARPQESVKNNQEERAPGNTEDGLQLESQKKTTRLVINLTLTSMDMSESQCESVAVSVESLLNDAKRMQTQCRERSEQLSMAAMQLRVESAALREQCEASQLDMAQIRRQLDELMDTKAAFEAKERQARKLSKQL
ncbi:hypothetical protein GBF38_005457 [Nibea albiflora]|uniref:Uncharacterized protein n=1 Tax=Nibea albiflora TaxID=240163 RepID=A0ACB7EW14_NIBAL|nr:hypothetical protein GBF38_005457 [Nibea albiflora]